MAATVNGQRGSADPGQTFVVRGIPVTADHVDAALLRTRLVMAADAFAGKQPGDLAVTVTNRREKAPAAVERSRTAMEEDQPTLEDRAAYFRAESPAYDFDFLVLPDETVDQLLLAVHRVERRDHLYHTWGLRRIDPQLGTAVNLHGPPGSGKTLAGHGIASRLGRRIIRAKYSQLESKYHGEGPKNLDALFYAATRDNAVLFIDEADSLLSRRFEVTSHGSEQAVNAMRNELIQAIDHFPGLLIFASNLVQSYDPAFDTRLAHVRFALPDTAARTEIWRHHLPPELPLAEDVSPAELARVENVSGREIKRAVIDAATGADRNGEDRVTQTDLLTAIQRIQAAAQEVRKVAPLGHTPTTLAPDSPLGRTIERATECALNPATGDAHPPTDAGPSAGDADEGSIGGPERTPDKGPLTEPTED